MEDRKSACIVNADLVNVGLQTSVPALEAEQSSALKNALFERQVKETLKELRDATLQLQDSPPEWAEILIT